MKTGPNPSELWTRQLAAPHWYIVRSNRGQERLALASLGGGEMRFEAYLPMIAKQNRRGETYGVPLFAGFLFIRLTLGAEGWTRIFSARGFASILGNGTRPSPLADKVIHKIKAREHEGFVQMGLVANPSYAKGQAVQVRVDLKDGQVDWIDAIFEEQVDEKRGVILLRLLSESPRLARVSLAHLREGQC